MIDFVKYEICLANGLGEELRLASSFDKRTHFHIKLCPIVKWDDVSLRGAEVHKVVYHCFVYREPNGSARDERANSAGRRG